jgi:iron complex outermembrane receptor protein
MTFKFKRGRALALVLLAGTVLGGATVLPGVAAAQDQGTARAYDIPAGSLSDALNRFAEQSGVQLTYEAALTQGRRTSGLHGSFAPRDALSHLLSGTGLAARTAGEGALTIARATIGTMTLDPLRLEPTTAAYTGTEDGSGPGDDDEGPRRGDAIFVLGHNDKIDATSTSGPWGNKLIIDTPYSVSVVSQDLIENVVASDMDQMFKMNPVVQNSAPSTVYGTPYVTIRGFDSQKGVIDGVRLSSTLTGIAMEELANVEIMNGLSGFLYGVGNPGGVTNYVLKRPTYTPTRDITVGNYGKGQFFAHVDLGGKIDENGTFAYRFNASYQDGDTSKKNQSIARTLVSGAVDWNVSPDLLVQVEGAHTYYRIDGIDSRFYAYANTSYGALGHWIEPLDAGKSWTPDWTFLQVKTDRAGANVKWKLSEAVSVRAAYLYKRDAQESVNLYPAYFADSGWQAGWPSRSGPSYNIAQGASGYVDGNFATGGITHHLTVGVSGDILRVKEHREGTISASNSPSFADPNDMMTWAMPGELKNPTWGPLYKSSQSSNLNVVIGDDIQFTEKLSAMVGVNRSTVRSTSYNSDATDDSPPTRYNKSAYTPTVSLVFKPVPRVTTYATYMEGLEPGDIIGNDPTYANPGQILAPFISKQYEVGAKYAPIDALLITGAVYRIEKANSFTEINSAGLWEVNQDGVEVHQGVELTVTGRVTPNLNVILGGTLMDLKVTKTDTPSLKGKKPTGVSDTLAKIYLDYALPWIPGLSVSGGAFHNGKMYKDSANLQKIDGSTIIDLGVHYQTAIANHPVRFDLNVANLTDENYWATSYSLGIPRNVAFSVKYGF